MSKLRWVLLLGAIAAIAATPSAQAYSAADAYSGQSQPEIGAGSAAGASGGAAAARRGDEDDGGLPFTGLDMALIVGGALILVAGGGLAWSFANRQQAERT